MPISRRDFLKILGGTGAAIAASYFIPASINDVDGSEDWINGKGIWFSARTLRDQTTVIIYTGGSTSYHNPVTYYGGLAFCMFNYCTSGYSYKNASSVKMSNIDFLRPAQYGVGSWDQQSVASGPGIFSNVSVYGAGKNSWYWKGNSTISAGNVTMNDCGFDCLAGDLELIHENNSDQSLARNEGLSISGYANGFTITNITGIGGWHGAISISDPDAGPQNITIIGGKLKNSGKSSSRSISVNAKNILIKDCEFSGFATRGHFNGQNITYDNCK